MKIVQATAALSLIVFSAPVFTYLAQTRGGKEMINKSTPIFHVKSVEPSIKFWTEKFGFRVTIQVPEGDHIGFAALENGSVELMYQTWQGMKADPSNPLAAEIDKGPTVIFMEVANIEAIIKALKKEEIVQDLRKTFYGAKEIVAREPGGHFVIFSELPAK